MADRSLRGTGLGAKSFEDEAGVEFAARQEVGYDCPREHHFTLVFAAEAEIPSLWECPPGPWLWAAWPGPCAWVYPSVRPASSPCEWSSWSCSDISITPSRPSLRRTGTATLVGRSPSCPRRGTLAPAPEEEGRTITDSAGAVTRP